MKNQATSKPVSMTLQKNAGAVRRFAKAVRFGNWLQGLPPKLTPAPFRLMQIGSAFWQSRALYVAARLDIATVLADSELDCALIAERVNANADAVWRVLRMLAAIEVFQETSPRVFRNSTLSDCLRTDRTSNVRAMILMHGSDEMSRPWFEELERGVQQGVPPFLLAHGEELFDYLGHHAEFDQLFSQAMDSVEVLAGDSFATDLDWGQFGRIIDLGGSRGSKALAILKHHPQLTALVVDRPQVIEEAKRYWADHSHEALARLTFQEGDLLGSIPSASSDRDIYLLSAVLHGFDDAACVDVLRNVARAIAGSRARVAVMEMVLPELHADIAGAAFDMQMFMGTRGRERTLGEWTALFARSGFALQEQVGLQSIGAILVLKVV